MHIYIYMCKNQWSLGDSNPWPHPCERLKDHFHVFSCVAFYCVFYPYIIETNVAHCFPLMLIHLFLNPIMINLWSKNKRGFHLFCLVRLAINCISDVSWQEDLNIRIDALILYQFLKHYFRFTEFFIFARSAFAPNAYPYAKAL